MGHLLSSFFLAISSNVDNVAVGVAYGVKKIKIGILSNLVIAVISASGTSFSMSIGEIISKFLPAHVARLLGSGVLLAIGVWGIWDTLRTERQKKIEINLSSMNFLTIPLYKNQKEQI
ncbi:MAG: hypothetical protein PUP92_05850 [Rhizonema sp. PD38]|nr:hypothetical protein [Rhizonema sp. PD38]